MKMIRSKMKALECSQHFPHFNPMAIEDTFNKRSWSVFRVYRETEKDKLSSLTALLSLFEEQLEFAAMIRHSMNIRHT